MDCINTRLFGVIVFLLFSCHSMCAQVNDDAIRQIVLENNIKDSLYVFGEWNEKDGTETHLKYLGILETQRGSFKIMTSCWLWGLSKRATNRLLIFDEEDNYIGYYYMGSTTDLPDKIENNRIIFFNIDDIDCDKKICTELSFDERIPKQFFIECKNGYGNLFLFRKVN